MNLTYGEITRTSGASPTGTRLITLQNRRVTLSGYSNMTQLDKVYLNQEIFLIHGGSGLGLLQD